MPTLAMVPCTWPRAEAAEKGQFSSPSHSPVGAFHVVSNVSHVPPFRVVGLVLSSVAAASAIRDDGRKTRRGKKEIPVAEGEGTVALEEGWCWGSRQSRTLTTDERPGRGDDGQTGANKGRLRTSITRTPHCTVVSKHLSRLFVAPF
ncbi:MAG: hypothetical protein CM15mP79_1890 [Methanobacteriota archaeon]|nr:MAG: hypothetical protein CM15mP79_1890 [Euryarchaeota archaeon]